jgi:hypothetical protein
MKPKLSEKLLLIFFAFCLILPMGRAALAIEHQKPIVLGGSQHSEPGKKENRKQKDSVFIRFQQDEKGARLETALVTYSRSDGVLVHLIGAVHIADQEYYQILNRIFTQYDALLFEMIGSANWRQIKEAGKKMNNPVSLIQTILKEFLLLRLQTDYIDYSAKNFVHADMDLATFLRKQKELGKSTAELLFMNSERYEEEMNKLNQEPIEVNITDILRIVLSKNSAREMKLMLAPALVNMIGVIANTERKMGSRSLLIQLRNQISINVLSETIQKGRKNIAIFYGAAHMPDLEKRLTQDLGFKIIKINWLTAWDIP